MSAKLALRNVKKSIRDYTVYFLTLTLGVCIFYAFNSIESQEAVMSATGGQIVALRVLDRIMGNFSVFISAMLAFLILYANGFLIKRRKKEFGLYMILGMGKWMTSRILVFETMFVGLISLCAGLLLGIFISQGMAVVTAKLLGAEIGVFRLVFSFSALLETAAYFGLAFVLAMIFNVVVVQKQKLIDLLYAAKKNEWFKTPRPMLSVLIFIASLCCFGVAYRMVLSDVLIVFQQKLTVVVALGIAGTFLFFFSLSGFLLRLLQQSRGLYLKNLNMFVLRQINSKINTAYVSMTLVCLMLFLAVSALSSGMGLAGALSDTLRGNTPFDATLSVRADSEAETETAYPGVDIIAAAREKGVDLDAFAAEYLAVRYYGADVSFTPDMNGYERDFGLNFMKLSDYNAVLAMQGVAPISLGAGEYALDSNMPSVQWREIITAYMQSGGEIELAGRSLRTDPSMLYAYMLEVSQNRSYDLVAVVPDELLLGAPAKADLLHVNYPQDGGEYEKLCTAALRGLDFAESGDASYAGLQTKAQVLEYSDSATATIAYLAVYMGVVSLLMAATVLAIGQLSEAGANVDRYGLLRKIGAEDRMIKGALFTQVFVYFCAPVLPALVHAAVGIAVAGKLVNFFGEMDILGGSLFAAVAVVIVYGGYFLAAYVGSRRMIMKGF